MRVPFADQSYESRSLPVSAQRLVNLYPETQPADAKARTVLFGTPGLDLFATAGVGPIRGAINHRNALYVVSGGDVFKVARDGTPSNLGTIGGSGRVRMASNGTELVIVSNQEGWVVDSGDSVAQITDADFGGAIDVGMLDGYHVFAKPSSGQFFISDLYDATAYDALDFATAEANPDDLVGLIVDHRELWLFGTVSTEVWYNSGAADFPFERNPAGIIERGCMARDSIAKADNGVFWLADDGIVYRAVGYQPRRISTHAIEHAIAGYARPEEASALTYTQEGHTFYALTFEEATWVYDAATQRWHERESGGNPWRIGAVVSVYDELLATDRETGRIYKLDLETYDENGSAIMRIATSPPLHADRRRFTISRMEMEIETGVGLTSGQGSDPQAMLEWSDDDGRSWSAERWTSIGQIGEYRRRAIWRRLGQSRDRIFRVTISDPVKVSIIAANVETQIGRL